MLQKCAVLYSKKLLLLFFKNICLHTFCVGVAFPSTRHSTKRKLDMVLKNKN